MPLYFPHLPPKSKAHIGELINSEILPGIAEIIDSVAMFIFGIFMSVVYIILSGEGHFRVVFYLGWCYQFFDPKDFIFCHISHYSVSNEGQSFLASLISNASLICTNL